MFDYNKASKEQFAELFRNRTKALAIDIIRFSQTLPKTEEATIMKRQLLRSATSVGANCRAACRARSSAEFFSKISIVMKRPTKLYFG
jgi:four helix bundle protein